MRAKRAESARGTERAKGNDGTKHRERAIVDDSTKSQERAAAEIKRLRAALQKNSELGNSDQIDGLQAAHIADEALKEPT